jgi:DNA-binding XRE family transcriptional regulator
MTTHHPYLDIGALQGALDAERIARGMTWAAVAAEVHVSVPSMRYMHTRAYIEADAAVLILQWLRRRCDDFVVWPVGKTVQRPRRSVMAPIPPLYARFDTIALHTALDQARQERGLTWAEVAAELGVSTGVVERFTKGGRTHASLMVAAASWAGKSVEELLQPSRPVLGPARMDAKAREDPKR